MRADPVRLPAWLLPMLGVALAGCAGHEVRSLATGGAPAYALTGGSLASLQLQAGQLCPRGHHVVQQWEHRHPSDPSAGIAAQWLSQARGWIDRHDEAGLTVQCRA